MIEIIITCDSCGEQSHEKFKSVGIATASLANVKDSNKGVTCIRCIYPPRPHVFFKLFPAEDKE